ncbi:MAG: hypothetical protein A3B96_02070 [Candidatus Spechtbacteria bacterium RIFCSPHIGHO2_02_FULL_43_15b]|nr:MAG: hypothetical protein A3B96_02070 [Candidatus Spechtbacteria bacterium RIFCSPHIGHO2_02_FULL_43_15b]
MIKLKSIAFPGTGGFLRPAEIMDKLEISNGMKVADLGCGSGYFTIPVARKVGKDGLVYAVDVLDSALDSVRSNSKLYSLLNIETRKGNLEKENGSGIEDKCVDLVILANILYQVKDKAGLIKEAKRVVKDGGKIVVIEWAENSAFGPSLSIKVPKKYMKDLAKSSSLVLEKEFDAGGSHYGLVFSM